jgi:hypothetical protein
MQITNPRLTVSQFGDKFDLFVDYTATFVPEEANFEFEDATVWVERDAGDDFDAFDPDVRTPGMRFRPQGQLSVNRHHEKRGVSADDLDSGIGDEDLVGLIHLRNLTLDGQAIRVRTNIVEIDA